MSNTVIAIRQSGETGNTPSLGVLANGELALNYADGILYFKSASNTLGSIRTTQPSGLDTEVQFNDGGSFGGDSGFTYNKTTNELTLSGNVSAANVLSQSYIQFGDGTKQFTANSGAANGFGVIFTSNNSTFANAITSNDTVTFSGVNGVAVAANATTKVITFAGTPGAQGLTVDYGFVTESIVFSLDYGEL
jgi:hypothetical protein